MDMPLSYNENIIRGYTGIPKVVPTIDINLIINKYVYYYHYLSETIFAKYRIYNILRINKIGFDACQYI